MGEFRWKLVKLSRPLLSWEQATNDARRLKAAALKVVKRWILRRQVLAWGRWWEQVRRARRCERAARAPGDASRRRAGRARVGGVAQLRVEGEI